MSERTDSMKRDGKTGVSGALDTSRLRGRMANVLERRRQAASRCENRPAPNRRWTSAAAATHSWKIATLPTGPGPGRFRSGCRIAYETRT